MVSARTTLLASLAFVALLIPARQASASVALHQVTPQNVAATDGIEVSARHLANGDLELTLRVEPAPFVYRPQVKLRPDGAGTQARWVDPNANPLVAVVRIPAASIEEAEVSVMRDFGLIGHNYRIRARDWTGGRQP